MNSLLWIHRTKILGGLIATISFVQAYPGLAKMLSEAVYAWVMFGLGISGVFLGFLNSAQIRAEAYDQALTEIRKKMLGDIEGTKGDK